MYKQLQRTVKWVNSKKKILFVLFFLMALLGTAIYRFVVQNNWMENEFSKQTKNIQLNNELSKLSLYIKNAESATRGYAIAGDKKFIQNFDITIDSIRSAYLQVKQLDIRKIEVDGVSLFIQSDKLIERKIDFMKRVKSLCDNNNCQAALALISTKKGQQLADSITTINNQISINIETYLKDSQKNFLRAKRINSGIAYVSIAVSILLILIIFYLLTIHIRKARKISEELRVQKENYRVTLNSLGEGLITTDMEGQVLYMNPSAEKLTGWNWKDAEKLPLQEVFNVVNEETGQSFEHIVTRILKCGKKVEWENNTILKAKNTNTYIISNNGSPIVDVNGNISGSVLVFSDITEKKEREILLQQSEEKYRSMVELNPAGIYQTTMVGKIVSCNNAFANMLGYASEKELKQIDLSLLYFSTSNRTDFISLLKITGKLYNQEIKLKHKDGYPVYMIDSCSLLKDIITGEEIIEGVLINVTERKMAVQQLAESEKNLRHVLSSASESFYVIDRKCYVTLISKQASENLRKAWGQPVNVGTNILPLLPDENDEPVRGSLLKVFAGQKVEYELHRSYKDLPAWVRVNFMPIIDEKGVVAGAYIGIKDITEIKIAAEAIRESNEKYELITKATSDMVWDWNVLTKEVYRSKEGWKKIFKTEGVNYAGNTEDWHSKIHPDDQERVETIRQELINSGNKNFFEIECRVLTNDGTYANIHDKGYIIRNKEGAPLRIIGAASDVTQQKQAEEEVKKLSLIARETVNAVIITDAEEKIQWVNEAFTRMTEYTMEEVVGKWPGHFLQGPESNPVIVRYMRRKIKNRQNFECDIINYSKSGKKYWVRIQCQPEFDATGKLLSFFSIQTEITKEKEIEEALKSSEERYRHLFDNNPESIFIWDMDTLGILEVNNTAVREYGYTKEEFTQLTVLDVRSREEYGKIKEQAKKMKIHPEKSAGIWKHRNKAGEEMYMSIVCDQILYKGKMVVLGIANNITEKILLEKVLEEERVLKTQEITNAVISAQEFERQELGRELHDNINQILASSRLYLGMAKKDVTGNNEYIAETDNLINTAIAEIRTLSHTLIPPSLGESGLIEALDDIIHITTKTTSITIQKSYTGICENAISDKFKLTIYRIVQEQFNNIIKYAHAKTICLQLLKQDNKMKLSIKDDGVGFETAKKAKGVGLINIQTRASLFNGELKIISSPGNGCELTVVFSEE